MRKHVGVIGGGFVGCSSALHLLDQGVKVTLLDSTRPGSRAAASYGNAGVLANYATSPIQNPALPFRLPGMLSRHDGPVAFARPLGALARWAVQPATLRWLGCFLSNCRPSKVAATQQALAALLRSAESGWQVPFASLTAEERTRAFGGSGPTKLGACLLFESLDAAKADLARREAHGVRGATLNAAGLLELEPAFERAAAEGRVLTGNYFPDAWHLASPGALVTALAAAVARAPLGRVLSGTHAVEIIIPGTRAPKSASAACDGGGGGAGDGGGGGAGDGGGSSAQIGVHVRQEGRGDTVLRFDEVVVACGAHSKGLAASVGDDLPLDTERGYHLTYQWSGGVAIPPPPNLSLRRPVGHTKLGILLTPMFCPESGAPQIRCAGTVELGGFDAPANSARLDAIAQFAETLFPPLRDPESGWRRVGQPLGDWLGFRPTLPDSLPVIGRSSACPQVVYAFGHQHLGWTLGGVTGSMVAQLVCGEVSVEPSLSPFAPGRSFL
jgi:glycine/D-amino acid oxidase-like deaminating enzyme